MNPLQMLQMIKGSQNPQQIVMNMLQEQAQANPMCANFLQLIKGNKIADAQKIVENLAQQRGIDIESFKKMLGGI